MASVAKRTWTHAGETKSAWVVRYTDGFGQRHQQTFDTRRDAARAQHVLEVELKAGTHLGGANSASVKAVAELFLRNVELKVRSGEFGRTTLVNTRVAIDNYIVPCLGKTLVSKLAFVDIERWVRGMVAGGLSAVTARKHLGVLTRVEAFAARLRLTPRAVAAEVRDEIRLRDADGPSRRTTRVFSIPEMQHLLRTVEARPREVTRRGAALVGCFVHLAAFCGLRFGEINGLTRKHVDLGRCAIRVRHGMSPFRELRAPKTAAGRRDIPMSGELADRLRSWLDEHYVENEAGLLFLTREGTVLTGPSFHVSYWRPLLRRADLLEDHDRFHFHALRHVYSSLMGERLPMVAVARLLGHSKVETTLQHYAHAIAGGGTSHRDGIARAAVLTASTEDAR